MYEACKELLRHHTSFLVLLLRSMRFQFRKVAGLSVRRQAVERYCSSYPVRKLQIGAGGNLLAGWLNTDLQRFCRDVVSFDATKRFPFTDATFDYVSSEHLIGHITYPQGLRMSFESLGVLKPGSKIRLTTPDLEIIVGLYAREKSPLQRRHIEWKVDSWLPEVGVCEAPFVINDAFYECGDHFTYDSDTLRGAMEQARFVNITRHAVGESNDKSLRGIESHHHLTKEPELTRFEIVVLLGERPI